MKICRDVACAASLLFCRIFEAVERLIPAAIAVGIPIIFLYVVCRLDLYAGGGFRSAH